MDLISRTDISGDGWSLRGNGALIVPVVAGPALMAAGWAALALWFRGEPGGLTGAFLAGALTILLSGAAGFAPVMLPGIPIPLSTLVLALGAGLGLAVIFGRPTRVTYVATAIIFVLALALAELAGGSVTLIAPLLVPLLVAVPLFTATAREGHPADLRLSAPWQALGYVAVPVAVIGGFMAATFFAPPILAANDPARSGHTATLLDDGRVLIVGGFGDHGSLATAWLYDPTVALWTRAPSMSVARMGHTSTRLADGRVLAVGGACCPRPVGAEVFDVVNLTWLPSGPMAEPRSGHAATLLADGRVLVVGGFGARDFGEAVSELYEPSTNSWAVTSGMQADAMHRTLLGLPTGRVLALSDNPRQGSAAAIYDPDTGRWSSTEAPTGLPVVFAAATLADGRVLALGGQLDFSGQTSAALFDPRSQLWSAADTPSLSVFEGATTTVLQDGRVLRAGGTALSGSPPRGEPTPGAEMYDSARNAWSATGSMTRARSGHSATLLADGRVLVVGGSNRFGALASAEIYDPRAANWQATTSIGG